MELWEFTIAKIHNGLLRKEFSAVELANYFLNRIEKLDKRIFSFLTLTPDLAISQAKEVDVLISRGNGIPKLAGIPLAIKDNILLEGVRCTAGSKILENYTAAYEATVIRKLKREKAVFLGKTNLDEFAMGSSTENSAFGPTKNPHDLTRVPGGSSGGSGAAVAVGLCVGALGSDTGGSIRLPASFCGIVGLKPTYGAVSRYGLIAMASSLDQIGPMAKTVDDAKIIFEAISGRDPLDSTSVDTKFKIQNSKFKIQDLKVGVPKEYFIKGIDKGVEKIIKSAIDKLDKEGIKIQEVSLPHTEYALASYYIIMSSEVSANLARYDGIRYGKSEIQNPKSKIQNLLDVYLQTRGEFLGPEVRRRIMLGTYALSAGYYEAYYIRAQKVRRLISDDFKKVFQKVDIILGPTSPTPAFKFGERTTDPLKMYLSDIYTVSANLAGIPALSVPVGRLANLPVGLQLMAQPFSEGLLFRVGNILEKLCSTKQQ